jgi:FAD/FMN-containing dehydrogenase
MTDLSGWGGFPKFSGAVTEPASETALVKAVTAGAVIARGNGRAYGDSAIGLHGTINLQKLNHMLSFDRQSGVLVAEAGVLLSDIITAFLPHGWFPSVTPGTKFVTLGGMIAADVHGKNHHKDGSFRNFVDWLDVMDADGVVHRCNRNEKSELFEWTIGGMGLTGIILRAAIRLRAVPSAWIRQTAQALPNLDAVISAFEASDEATYSVAWIDCLQSGGALGRAILMLGEHAVPEELSDDAARYPYETPKKTRRSVPFAPPFSPLNGLTVRAFNALYYWNGSRKSGISFLDYDTYFYPLDAIHGWNKIYGRRGFMQFQCVLPLETSRKGLDALLKATSQEKAGSFLAVLKRFGPQDSAFSFPMLGYTLALDFPATPRMIGLMRKLDRITLEHGGRFYLAKDSRMSAQTLHASDARTEQFRHIRAQLGAAEAFQSQQSQRLGL